jgi:nucleotide-binding universal stress UspA family protein
MYSDSERHPNKSDTYHSKMSEKEATNSAAAAVSPVKKRKRVSNDNVDDNKATTGAGAIRQIVVALDGSAPSKHALEWAIDNIVRNGDAVTVVFAYESKPLVTLGAFETLSVAKLNIELEKKLIEHADHLRDQYNEIAMERGGIELNFQVLQGSPKQAIVDYCTKHKSDLLVGM